jgi:hypothetical protein
MTETGRCGSGVLRRLQRRRVTAPRLARLTRLRRLRPYAARARTAAARYDYERPSGFAGGVIRYDIGALVAARGHRRRHLDRHLPNGLDYRGLSLYRVADGRVTEHPPAASLIVTSHHHHCTSVTGSRSRSRSRSPRRYVCSSRCASDRTPPRVLDGRGTLFVIAAIRAVNFVEPQPLGSFALGYGEQLRPDPAAGVIRVKNNGVRYPISDVVIVVHGRGNRPGSCARTTPAQIQVSERRGVGRVRPPDDRFIRRWCSRSRALSRRGWPWQRLPGPRSPTQSATGPFGDRSGRGRCHRGSPSRDVPVRRRDDRLASFAWLSSGVETYNQT